MDGIEQAKAVIRSHEEFAAAADIDAVLSNMAEDVVILAPDSPLVEGLSATRALYEAVFAMGAWELDHDYPDATEAGDFVSLHGVARGSVTAPGQDPAPFANNFMLVVRRAVDGVYRFWQVAFAPSGE